MAGRKLLYVQRAATKVVMMTCCCQQSKAIYSLTGLGKSGKVIEFAIKMSRPGKVMEFFMVCQKSWNSDRKKQDYQEFLLQRD